MAGNCDWDQYDTSDFEVEDEEQEYSDDMVETLEDLPECGGDETCYSCGGRLDECGENTNGSEVLECRSCGELQVR